MNDYQEYIAIRNIKNKEDTKIQNLEQDLANMKDDINEIKSLLRNLVNGSN